MKINGKGFIALVFCFVSVFFCACSHLERTTFTAQDMNSAYVDGFADVRFWLDEVTPELDAAVEERVRGEAQLPGDELNWLMLSGGGEDGAFGAGVLNGMTEAGTRPDFVMVSGVSTGALTAPFAFLGSSQDEQLKRLYTTVNMDKLVISQFIKGLIGGGDGLVDTAPLRKLIAASIDEAFLAAVAREHDKGRRLIIITTNLDVQRPVMWDMGLIAKRGNADAVKLFCDVMLASASIPGAFPPVMIESTVNGRKIKEMHVDGGTTMQVMTIPVSPEIEEKLAAHHNRKRNVYLVMNNRMQPDFALVPDDTLSIGSRGMSTLIKYHGMGSVYLYHYLARVANMGFNLAYIPPEFVGSPKEPFEQEYMQRLFEFGRQQALAGKVWMHHVPNVKEEQITKVPSIPPVIAPQ